MADSSERNNPPHFEEEEEEEEGNLQVQREITNNQPQTEPDDDDDEDYVDDDFDEEEEEQVEEEEEEESDSEEDNDEDEEEEEDEEVPAVMSPRVSVNSVEADGETNGCGEGGKVAAAAEVSEVDGLICPICMGPWTSAGDHQLCCLSCGHLYGLSCIRRWLERSKGSAKCPQCNQKCKPKDVRVIYASRVVVADEESKEKIQRLEAEMTLLGKMTEKFGLGIEVVNQQLAALLQEQRTFFQKQDTFWQEQRTFFQKHDTFWQEERTFRRIFEQKQDTFQQEQRTNWEEQRAYWEERAKIENQRYEEQQRKFAQFSQFMQQQTCNSSQPSSIPLPPGPSQ